MVREVLPKTAQSTAVDRRLRIKSKVRMTVIRPGLLHEYCRGEFFEDLEAHLACLEKLAPQEGSRMRAQVDEVIARHGRRASAVDRFLGECSGKLDALAPKGMYFGRPNSVSNMSGFWPSEWLKTVASRPTVAEARKLGACVIDSTDASEWNSGSTRVGVPPL